MMSTFFIRRPIFSSVISILLVVIGAVAYFQLPVAQYPELAPPVVRVEALYPGANAQTIADTVAAPLEQEVNGVDRMIYMQSTSSDSRYSLDISFEVGTDIDMAAVLVQNRVNIALARLPEDVRRQGVTTRKQSTNLAGVISLSSDSNADGTPLYDDLFLSNYMTINWRDEFARIYGVGAINIIPAKDYGMRIWLDPEKLKARNLTVNDVTTAIRQQNVQVAAGKIGAQPAPSGTDFELMITTKGRLTQPEEFADIIVKSEDGRIVRVKDIARIELGARDYSTISTFNRRPNAVMVTYQLPGANLVELTQNIEKKLDELRPALPKGVSAKFFYDSSMFIEASMHEVIKTLIEAFILVFLVVLIFLQSLRTTIIPALAIPVSLIGTFMFMQLLGFSVNMLTMFGMVLAIGIVVDDAIVVVENVERNMTEFKLGAVEATIKAMGEITGAIIAITLVLMSVFIPAAVLPGITGEMYRQFALTIAASTALSALCALTLSPALCALLLKAHDAVGGHAPKSFILFRPFAWVGKMFNRIFDAITSVYTAIIGVSCRAAGLMLIPFVGILLATAWLYPRVPTGFVPNEDLGFVVVAAQLPDGSSLERSNDVIDRVSDILLKDASGKGGVNGVQDVVTLSGFSVLDGNGTNLANAWIVLEPWDVRSKTNRPVEAIIAEINAKVSAIQEARFLVFSLPAIPGLGNASAIDMRVQDRGNLGRAALQRAADEAMGAMMGQQPPKIAFAFSSYREGTPQLFLDIDREKALKLNIPLQSVFETLQTYLGSAYVNDFNQFGRTWQVTMQAESAFRLRAEDIARLDVRTARGEMVPLGTLLTVRDGFGPERVTRYNMYTTATLNGIPIPGVSSGDAMATMAAAAKATLPPEMGTEWSGLSFQEARTGNQAVYVFAFAILLVYLILAAQYESFFTPVGVVVSIPLVIIGALAALYWRNLDNNVFTQIGLVLLVGLGAKNAILIVEFARENRAKGVPIAKAATEAARTRFRPIIMTSLAFILGVLPLTIAEGAGAASRRALGTAVMGGMIGNTILCLLFVPAIYVIVQWIAEKLFGSEKYMHTEHTPDAEKPQPTAAPASA
jgi:hydrophobic/amphiphilic exporter-1 (mainly G- bacteria), HAE1 family